MVYKLWDVLEHGPIVAFDKEAGLIVTVSKSCFSVWHDVGKGSFLNGHECMIKDLPQVGDCTDFDKVVAVAYQWLKEVQDTEGEDTPSNS